MHELFRGAVHQYIRCTSSIMTDFDTSNSAVVWAKWSAPMLLLQFKSSARVEVHAYRTYMYMHVVRTIHIYMHAHVHAHAIMHAHECSMCT